MLTEKLVKQIIVKSNLPDCDYVINPYVGCQHGCAYCYARFMKRFIKTGQAWGQFCQVKINAVEVVKKQAVQLAKKHPKAEIFMSSVCDLYQPIEKKYQLTRKILQVLADYEFNIGILTKSDLVLRDIEVLKKIKNLEVGLTINTLSEKYQSIIEPGASAPAQRLKALKELRKAGIKTYGFISPVLPEITDLEELVKLMKDQVDYFYVETLNTYAASWGSLKKCLAENFLGLLEKYQHIFDNKQSKQEYVAKIGQQVRQLSKKYQVQIKIIIHNK